MYLPNSQLYNWNHFIFTEVSKDLNDASNFNFYNRLNEIKNSHSDVQQMDLIAVYRAKYFYLPLYWSEDVQVMEALKENLARNYKALPLEIIPFLSADPELFQNLLLPREIGVCQEYIRFSQAQNS